VLSPHDVTDSNSNSPILPPAIALSPACPKPSFVHGPKSSIPKVEDVSLWLRWAVDPISALRVLLLPSLLDRSSNKFLLLLLQLYLPLSLQGVGNPFASFFLLSHPTPASEHLSAAVVRPKLAETTQLYLKGPGDLALLVYSVVLFSLLQLVLSHTLFPMLAQKWGVRKAGKAGRFGEQGYAVVVSVLF
jgi:acyl-CoA-dependent ceramide synthase